jgi:DNA recombination-dependent growth factor C
MPRQGFAAGKASFHPMGFFSSSAAISRYRVEGQPEGPLLETVRQGLSRHVISDIDQQSEARTIGWTCVDRPYAPSFEDGAFAIADFFLFALRIDKKSIPAKVIQKHLAEATLKRKAETGRDFLSRSEKKLLKEQVLNVLAMRIPATPSIYDILWAYPENELWLFSTQKAACEALESLFAKSFNLSLVRLFPYTMAEFHPGLSDARRDLLNKLMPCSFAKRDGS